MRVTADMGLPMGNAPTLQWSVGRSRTSATWRPVTDRSWSDFVDWLDPEEPASQKEIKPYVGGSLEHGRRTARTVTQRFFLTLDADYAEADFPLEVALLLHEVPYLLHTTWRHTHTSPRYRLIIPLAHGVGPNEHKELAWQVMNRLGGEQFDKTTAQAERFMWGPSTQDPERYFWESPNGGAPYLHPDALTPAVRPAGAPASAPGGQAAPAPGATAHGAHSGPDEVTPEDVERAGEILAAAIDDVLHVHETGKFSGRNDAVFHLLPLLLRFADAGALDEDLVLDTLFYAAQQVPADEPYTRQEFDASVRSARSYADEEGPAFPETSPTRSAIADFEGLTPEGEGEDLWGATPQLRHIAQAADSLGRNRLSLLACVLARVLVRADPGVCLPGVEDGAIGSRAAINLGVALVGSSGQGKSTVYDKSGDLIPTPGVAGKPSTGQGLIQEYLVWNSDLEENVLIPDPRRLFYVDEVDNLTAMAADKTSTLMSEVRTMLTGGMTGSSNATAQRKRLLLARTYNFQLVVGVQPARSGNLLGDRDAGTPQRFIWTTTTDPGRAVPPNERPPWPGPLPWDDAFMLGFEVFSPVVEYPTWLKEELREYDYRVSQEGMEGGAVSWAAHQNLLRLKVSAGVAFLHESPVIEDKHVFLADKIIASSLNVQRACEKLLATTSFTEKTAKAKVDQRVLEVVGEEKVQHLVKTAKKKMRGADDWVVWKDLRPAYRDRADWAEPLWEALEKDPGVETEDDGTKRRARLK